MKTREDPIGIPYRMATSNGKYVTLDAKGWLTLGDEGAATCFLDADGTSDGKVHIKIHSYGGRWLGWTRLQGGEWRKIGSYRKILMVPRDTFKWEESITGKWTLKNSEGIKMLKKGDNFFFNKISLPTAMTKDGSPPAYEEKLITRDPCPDKKSSEPEKIKSWGFNKDKETFEEQIEPDT